MDNMDGNLIKDFLEAKVLQYNNPDFIELDPIQIPHLYLTKEDREIAGFLTAIISWGKRASILKSANHMMDIMGNSPHDFIVNHKDEHLEKLDGCIHRTFSAIDFAYFVTALKQLYVNGNGLEGVFNRHQTDTSLQPAIHYLKQEFFELPHLSRTRKHLPDPFNGSAAKRINMYLRWMVRKDNAGVDFGIWKDISPSKLSCPLDVHVGTVARKLGLMRRNQNDSRTVMELDKSLRAFDPRDPVKYDFALFGLGQFEKF